MACEICWGACETRALLSAETGGPSSLCLREGPWKLRGQAVALIVRAQMHRERKIIVSVILPNGVSRAFTLRGSRCSPS